MMKKNAARIKYKIILVIVLAITVLLILIPSKSVRAAPQESDAIESERGTLMEASSIEENLLPEEELHVEEVAGSDEEPPPEEATESDEEPPMEEIDDICFQEAVSLYSCYDQFSLTGSGNTRTFSVTDSYGTYSNLRVAVWSLQNNQDDLHWYTMTKKTNGIWTVDFSLSDLKHDGTIIFHVYTGQSTYIGRAQFICNSSKNTLTSLGITYSGDYQKITAVTASENASQLRIAVWSAEGGQDDLYWYSMEKNASNPLSWSAKVPLKNIKHEGTVYVHVYNKQDLFLGDLLFSVDEKDVQTDSLSLTGNTLEKTITFTTMRSYSNMRVAVWSSTGGQDDLYWYSMKRQSDDSWTAVVPQSRFKHTGNINYHVYTDTSTFLGSVSDTYALSDLSLELIKITTVDSDRNLTVITNGEACSDMRIAVWSAEGGQDDLYWYNLEKDSSCDLIWKGTIHLSHLKHKGKIYVHIYTGKDSFLGEKEFNIPSTEECYNTLAISGIESKKTITILPAKEYQNMRVAIWSDAGGQDDLTWYSMKKKNGLWQVSVALTNLKHNGLIHYHVYTNTNTFIAGEESFWSRETLALKTISLTDSGTKRALTVKTNGESCSNMRVAVWSADGGQDDLRWYSLDKVDEAPETWQTVFSVKDLKHSGNFYLHLYTDTATFLGSTTSTASTSDIEKGSIFLGNTEGMLTIQASVLKGSYHQIQAAVWTEEGDQDDLTWIDLRNQDGSWTAKHSLDDFKHRGIFIVHLYIDGKFYKGLSLTIKEEEQIQEIEITSSSSGSSSYDSNIDFVQYAINIAQNDAIGYGHTWPQTISCSGLVGLSLTNCGYADFVKNDPLGWGYIGLGSTFVNTLVYEIGCSVLEGPWTKDNCLCLQPGDILYSYDDANDYYHCGIYVGNGMTVEARGPEGDSPADTSGQEVAIYNWLTDPISFQRVYRIPANKIHRLS